ncbi:hypothetical protein [Capnocytophaga sp. oral taxon 326]|uniref:hypothetical protein n=1 Tax=Capnocytophaga sp. oral taxon 326 TaxID=712212 RepID=UPI0002A316F1|nr:hypothetical protein [Capnocytophaga sp. oral taxon 326]EKY12146.1 hypothetical protein HMPREF9073_02782 [Capnocytophaga sp. oral taxon 326 str. F0382]
MSDSIRTKEEMFDSLISIIKSDEFKNKLNELNDNFFNLKQEIQIRNLLVELFNQKHKEQGKRAIAEYPRIAKTRVDLSLIDKNNTETPFKIEFKYHFPKDKGGFSEYQESIQKHFKNRKSNGFILIVCDSNANKRKEFEKIWLSKKTKFSKLSSEDNIWKENLQEKFKNTADSQAYFFEITIENPFETTYHFFILERKQ